MDTASLKRRNAQYLTKIFQKNEISPLLIFGPPETGKSTSVSRLLHYTQLPCCGFLHGEIAKQQKESISDIIITTIVSFLQTQTVMLSEDL